MIFYIVSIFSLILFSMMIFNYGQYRSRFSIDHAIFYRFLIILGVIIFFETITRSLDYHAFDGVEPIVLSSGIMLFLLFPISTSLWALFINRLTFKPIQPSPWLTVIYFTPMVINTILTIVSLWTGWYFSYIPPTGYQDGPLFVVYFIIPFIYISFGSIYAFIQRDYIYPKFHFAVTIFPIPIFIGAIIQSFVIAIPLLIPSIVVTTFIIYSMLMEDLINVDPITKLYTAQELRSVSKMLSRRSDLKKRVKLISVTIQAYRLIFEQYGPKVAQDCLFEFGAFLAQHFKYASNLTRLDGAEFIIFDFTKESSSNIKRSFEHALELFNDQSSLPFKVKVTFVLELGDALQTANFDEMIYKIRLMSVKSTGIQYLESKS